MCHSAEFILQSLHMRSGKIRILLVDNQASVRQGLRMQFSLEPDLEVIGEAADGNAAILISQHLKPDVTVMDVDMPLMNGICATEQICQNQPDNKVVILTMYADPVTKRSAEAAGAIAVIEKQPSPILLMSAIRNAHSCVSNFTAFI